jgi:hypothetical protein
MHLSHIFSPTLCLSLVTVGLVATTGTQAQAQAQIQETAQETASPVNQVIAEQVTAASTQSVELSQQLAKWQDGFYLYGQTPEPDQIGQAYMVFEAQDNQVKGAFYMPYSSFDCFHGQVETDRFALNIINTYSNEVYDYQVAIAESEPVAGNPGAIEAFNLEGFHQITALSDNDHRILGMCQVSSLPSV